MDDSRAFSRQLEERLDARRVQLDGADLPRLKDSFKTFQLAFVGMNAILRTKGLLHDDPYRFDLKISDVTIPSTSYFSDAQKVDQMSMRVSQLEAYLEFLNGYYQFSCDFLTLGRIKRLLALVTYFNFTQFAETSSKINTRALCEIVTSVRKGSDQLSSRLMADSILRLEKASRDILIYIKDLAEYHRERYKLELRQIVMSELSMDADLAIGKREEATRLIKRKFAEVASDRPFYPELVEEVLLEDFSSDGPALREERLRRFAAVEGAEADDAKARSLKATILAGVRSITAASLALGGAIAKLEEDSKLLFSLDLGLGMRLRRMFLRAFPSKKKGLVYELQIVDPITRVCTMETLDFGAFAEEMGNKAHFLYSLAQRGGASARRLEGMSDAQAFDFLQRNIAELQRALRIFAALEEYFKSATPKKAKTRIRGVQAEIATIKGAVIQANQKKREFVARSEELEQMKRLGIKDSAS